MSPIERPLIHTLFPIVPITNDAVILLIVNSSSAAFAQIRLASFPSCDKLLYKLKGE